jgi:hypothetical protein
MPTDDEKLERLIREGVVDADLPDAYKDAINGLTPDEVEVISSIGKRFRLAGKVEGLPDEDAVSAAGAIHF